MPTKTLPEAKGLITASVLMEQLHLTLIDHPDGGNWTSIRGQASTAAAIGRFRVIFRLLALLQLSREEAEQLKTELVEVFAKVGDSNAQMAFYRGMSMILRPRGVKLPEKPYLTMNDSDWHKPL